MAAFWEMTPRETFAALDAAAWREERQARHDIRMAWFNANWQRAKRMPSLQSILNKSKAPKPMTSADHHQRRQEFKRMASPDKIARINEHMKKLKVKAPKK